MGEVPRRERRLQALVLTRHHLARREAAGGDACTTGRRLAVWHKPHCSAPPPPNNQLASRLVGGQAGTSVLIPALHSHRLNQLVEALVDDSQVGLELALPRHCRWGNPGGTQAGQAGVKQSRSVGVRPGRLLVGPLCSPSHSALQRQGSSSTAGKRRHPPSTLASGRFQ